MIFSVLFFRPFAARLQQHRPLGIMGTEARLQLFSSEEQRPLLEAAEAALRAVEARMSSWIQNSEVGLFNRASVGFFPLSISTLQLLSYAQEIYTQSQGAFDISCRPLLRLWRRVGKQGELPSTEELEIAREASHWDLLRLQLGGAEKLSESLQLDLGGLAKGQGIDEALAALRAEGVLGALVEVGGDLAAFGHGPENPEGWWIAIQDPSGGPPLGRVLLRDQAICSSGHTQRFVEIQGKRYSHIVDPRTGWPVETVASASVIAPSAREADAWATALSVLGVEGLAKLPEGVEALLLLNGELQKTAGFPFQPLGSTSLKESFKTKCR